MDKHDEPNEIAEQENLLPRIANYIIQGVASWYGPGFMVKKPLPAKYLTCMP